MYCVLATTHCNDSQPTFKHLAGLWLSLIYQMLLQERKKYFFNFGSQS